MLEYTATLAISTILDSFICAYGLLAYVVVLVPLYRFRRCLFANPFYTACITLAWLDILSLIDRLSLKISDPLLPVTNAYVLQIRSFYERFLWYGIACVQFVIAAERMVAVFSANGIHVLTNRMIGWTLALMFFVVFITNVCVLTPICPYVWYENTTTVFIDLTVPTAVLHNKIVDWCLQPLFMCVTVLLYVISGLRVLRVRRTVLAEKRTDNLSHVKKLRLQHVLFLHGLFVSIPHTIIIIVYHIMFYFPTLPSTVLAFLNLTFQFMSVFGSSLNGVLHFVLNRELRAKAVECWCPKPSVSLQIQSILKDSKNRNNNPQQSESSKSRRNVVVPLVE